ncbi:MAG: tetratricopeptide repeat protein [Thermodesulfobacteriota bacterium]
MANRIWHDESPWEEDASSRLESFLPPFPPQEQIRDCIGTATRTGMDLGKPDFAHWVEFTLENPDEVWENDGLIDTRYYHYISFINQGAEVPAFVVEVIWADDVMEVNNYALIVHETHLEQVRSGALVYSLGKEWQRESLIRALNEQALEKYDQDCLDRAKEMIDRAIQLSGGHYSYLFNNRGLICWKMGLTELAKENFLEAIKLEEANGDAYFNLGLIYFDESDHSRALQYLGKAVELHPNDSQFLTELGHLHLEMEHEREALVLFKRAFQNNPDDPQVDFHLGYYFLYKKNRPRDAVKYYHRGLVKDPDDQFALADLAVAHFSVGNKRKALRIRRILQDQPRLMPYTVSRLVYLSAKMGDYENALKYYRRALSLSDPYEPEWLHYYAAVVYAKTGQPEKALDILKLAVGVGGSAVIKRAMSEEALQPLKQTSGFKMLRKMPGRRGSR